MMLRILFLGLLLQGTAVAKEFVGRAMPEFTSSEQQHWINSEPLSAADLRGKVVLLDVWTFDCWNCYRSFPWLKMLEMDLHDQAFQVIGIHSPEFDHEHEPERVMAKVQAFGLQHPVMMDNDFAYWRALENRYWPAFYLVDKTGKIRYRHVGETHVGDARARKIRSQIQTLLSE